MAKRRGFGRPTRAMQEAVNLALEGKRKAAADKLTEDDRNTEEAFEHFLDLRQIAGPYDLSSNRRPRRRAAHADDGKRHFSELEITIDGRTSVVQLFRLIDQAEQVTARAQQELKRRPEKEVDRVRKKLGEIALLHKRQTELERQIKEVEQTLG